MLRDKNFNTYVFEHKLKIHTNIRENILIVVLELFNDNYNKNIIYRSTWVIFSWFKSFLPRQMSIFDKKDFYKDNQNNLSNLINAINLKYWNNKIAFWFSLLWRGEEAKLTIMK